MRNLEKELQEIEAENKALSSQLDQYMESEETLRIEAIASLQRLDEVSSSKDHDGRCSQLTN